MNQPAVLESTRSSFPSFDLRWMARVPPVFDLLYRVLLTREKRRFHTTPGPPLERKNPPSRIVADSFPVLAASAGRRLRLRPMLAHSLSLAAQGKV
jgi:hypothetical protein